MSIGTKTLSFFKAIALALITGGLMTLFMQWLGYSEAGLSAGVSVFATSFSVGIMRFTSFWSVMLIINAILLILAAGLAVYGLLKDKNTLVLPFAAIGVLMFFLAIFQTAFIGESEIRLRGGPWLLLLLGLLAFAAAVLDNLSAGKKPVDLEEFGLSAIKLPAVKLPVKGGWTCPTCGAALAGSLRFCDRCGTPKPELPRCPGCGKAYQPGESFCASCGSPLN